MENSEHVERPYMKVFAWLGIITLVEVGITFLPIAKLIIILFLIALAVSKALLVAMYYMHLKYDRRILTVIAVSPLVLAALLTLALLPDIVFHGG